MAVLPPVSTERILPLLQDDALTAAVPVLRASAPDAAAAAEDDDDVTPVDAGSLRCYHLLGNHE